MVVVRTALYEEGAQLYTVPKTAVAPRQRDGSGKDGFQDTDRDSEDSRAKYGRLGQALQQFLRLAHVVKPILLPQLFAVLELALPAKSAAMLDVRREQTVTAREP